ncbi:MAG TPA: DNA ligase D [Candidatus Limnocylindria bacterium]|nr:DNA ligase D [Candidatus Limnocylindria bacterium]
MPLEAYRSKRDFGRTAEPAGGEPGGDGRRFTVQRHRATALHYDFRLEIDGVLVSWAVPKGPTLDPGEKRLAMRTEDHPIEYLDFEGTIGAGQYGAGDVIVWDWGTWEPEETRDPAASLRKGELKFRLHGERLNGRFTIVRTSGRHGDQDDREKWLLMHKQDEAAVAGWDAEDHPTSVKSGRTNDEVKAGRAAKWDAAAPAAEAEIDLTGARDAGLPDFVPPMRATLASGPFSDPDWLYEVKWDGYRVEAVVRGADVRLFTRNRQDAGRYFPTLAAARGWIEADEAIVDGEVIAVDARGRPDFSLLQDVSGLRGLHGQGSAGDRPRPAKDERAAIPLVYQAFDLLHLDGRSLLGVALEQRKRLLRSVLREHPMVRYGSHVVGDGEAFVDAAREQELEGVVAKLRRSHYEPGRRSKSWLKIKLRREQEVIVAGWLEGQGSHRDLGSLIVAVRDGERLRHAGQVGSGIDTRTRRELRARLDELARDDSPLDSTPRLKGAHWVEPRIVIRVEFAEWTTDGLLRQAAFKGFEIGKDARSVRREDAVDTAAARRAAERAVPTSAAPKRSGRARPGSRPRRAAPATGASDALRALDGLQKEGSWEVHGREVRVTNLEKVLFPGREGEPPLTKRDLFRYMAVVGPTLVPYLDGRGTTVQRYPNGVEAKGFWQKDLPGHTPDWIQRWTFHHREEGPKDYIVVSEPATLAWLAQEAALELHPWTSRTDAPDRPTYALIDIDPGSATTWDEVLVLARLYRTALEHLGVIGLPKVTGKRGLQVWIPIERRYTFDETRDWVEGVSRAVGQMVPDLVSWEWAKQARRGRARLDFTQNAVNRTLVAPYSPRPAAGAPVSAPIRWDELDDPDLRPDRWTIRTLPERLATVGDLFAEALTLQQRLPPL